MIEVVHDARALRARCDELRAGGQRLGFVPTLGALHAGHMSLCAAARAHGAARVVTSIFVNPLQFGPNEDFARYPRTLEADLALCERHGVELVYTPDAAGMYPQGFQTHVEVEQLTRGFEAEVRPSHFRGVTTVVAKLFNAVGPCIAAFGQKDYQQCRVIERMVRDLEMPIELRVCPTLREADGLAMSSRNRYLEPEQRSRATAIVRGLRAAQDAYRAGERDPAALERAASAPIEAAFDSIDYVKVADAETLEPFASGARVENTAVVLCAARLGKTRLIDNTVLGRDRLPET